MEHALLAFSLLSAPIDTTRFNNPLIEPEPIAVVTETIKELTVEEKIASNFYKCDEATQWIWASDATCHDKQVVGQISRENTSKPIKNQSQASSGWYEWGWCTYYVSTQRQVGQWNDAISWPSQARNDGYTVSTTPIVGAIAQKGNHVAIVRAVENGQITIQEMNYEGFGVISSRTISPTGWQFIY